MQSPVSHFVSVECWQQVHNKWISFLDMANWVTMRCHHYHKNIGFQTHKKINKQHHLKNCDSGCSTYKHFLCMSRKDQNFGYCKSISHLNSMHHALPHMCLTPVWWNVDLCVYVNSAGRNVANNFGFSITLWNALFFPCYVR